MPAVQGISLIIPVYNEAPEVLLDTVRGLHRAMQQAEVLAYEILIINDGSEPEYDYEALPPDPCVRLIQHHLNKGYGAALKTGIQRARYDWIGITDADGTYPNDRFADLLHAADAGYDMVVGARNWSDISLLRRFPKWILTRFASFLAGYPIRDLNSGMRIFRKAMAREFWRLYPNGFSFTSTITMACVTHAYELHYVPIDYFKRVGKSSIHPIKDTYRFFALVTRLALYFNPLRFFLPLSLLLGLLAVGRGLRDYSIQQSFGGLTLVLFFMAFQVFFFGLLAEIISKTRTV